MTKTVDELLCGFSEKKISKSGYNFSINQAEWILDKNTRIPVRGIYELIDKSLLVNYLKTLCYYAENLSSSHADNIHKYMLHMFRVGKTKFIDEVVLINYRAKLSAEENEYYLGTIRGFLRKWHDLGLEGISDDVIELLDSWTLKGNVKGDVVKRLDPAEGPLSNLELQAFNEGAIRAYEGRKISLRDLAMGLVISNTGRRSIQISHLRRKDVLKGKNKAGDDAYFLNVPRAKQRGTGFRESFKQFAITEELWVILMAQAEEVLRSVALIIKFEFQASDALELPLFPDMDEFTSVTSMASIKALFKTDQLHVKSSLVTEVLKNIAISADIYSERTGEPLNIMARRFRYTIGTRAAAEGFGKMVIAELLDHSDNQNAGVYVEHRPEFVKVLSQAIGHQMAPFAQAFGGVLVDAESDATRGRDLNSRVKVNGEAIATCGNEGFCGANVPIPCYTCIHFQPWLDGPHELVYDKLISDRERVLEVTGDEVIAAVNDLSILAVADVIQRCAARKAELKRG